MTTMIDIVGSAVIAGVILVLVFNMNYSMGNMAFQTTLDAITQENSKTIADLINWDFYKIGYRDTFALSSTNPAIMLADTNAIRFRADVKNNPTVDIDTIYYCATVLPYAAQGSTIHFEQLYRLVNTTSLSGPGDRLGITSFKFSYYDVNGKPMTSTPIPDTLRVNIKSIKVQMTVKNPITVNSAVSGTFDTTFAAIYWEKWISPKNLRTVK